MAKPPAVVGIGSHPIPIGEPGAWLAVEGVWVFLPDAATSGQINGAIWLLERMAAQRDAPGALEITQAVIKRP